MPGRNKHLNPVIMAIDWGSQSARCALFTRTGERLGLVAQQFPPLQQQSQSAKNQGRDAQSIRRQLFNLIRDCLHTYSSGCQVVALAICAQRSGLISLCPASQTATADRLTTPDAELLEACGPVLCWHDPELSPHYPLAPAWIRWGATLIGSQARLHELLARAPVNRLRASQPELWRRARYLLPWSAFLNWCLCGQASDGRSGGTGIYPFHFRHARWHHSGHWTWAALSSQPSQMPELYSGGQILGRIHAAAAQACGLSDGTPVIACGADKAAEVLGAGAWQPGDLHLSLGTAVSLNRLEPTRWSWNFLKPSVPSLGTGLALKEQQLEQGLGVIRNLLALNPAQLSSGEAELDHCLATENDKRPALLCYPQHYPLSDIQWMQELAQRIPLEQLYPALLHGLVFHLREALGQYDNAWSKLGALSGVSTAKSKLYVSGGGSQGKHFLQLLAQVLNRPLAVAQDPQCGLRGAAMCAAVGAGWFRELDEARVMASPHYWVYPGAPTQRGQTEQYRKHWHTYAHQKQAWVELRERSV